MSVSLEAAIRATRPRSLRNQLRHEGKIPAVVYGYEIESTSISVDSKDLEKILRTHGANTVITMNVDGKEVNTLLYKAQEDTFNRALTHIEFLSVNMNEATELETEIVLVGEAAGVRAGGVLTQDTFTVIVSATPDKLPESIEVNVAALEIGDSLTIADLPKNADYTIIADPEEQIVGIKEAHEIEEPEAVEGEVVAPEVIGETEAEDAE